MRKGVLGPPGTRCPVKAAHIRLQESKDQGRLRKAALDLEVLSTRTRIGVGSIDPILPNSIQGFDAAFVLYRSLLSTVGLRANMLMDSRMDHPLREM